MKLFFPPSQIKDCSTKLFEVIIISDVS